MTIGQRLLRQARRFMTTGILATGLHAATVMALVTLVVPAPSQVSANGVAFIVANVFSYVVNSLWSFSAPLHGLRFVKFFAVSVIGFLGTLLVAYVAEHMGLSPLSGIVLVVCIMTPVTFILHRAWTFRGADR